MNTAEVLNEFEKWFRIIGVYLASRQAHDVFPMANQSQITVKSLIVVWTSFLRSDFHKIMLVAPSLQLMSGELFSSPLYSRLGCLFQSKMNAISTFDDAFLYNAIMRPCIHHQAGAKFVLHGSWSVGESQKLWSQCVTNTVNFQNFLDLDSQPLNTSFLPGRNLNVTSFNDGPHQTRSGALVLSNFLPCIWLIPHN